MTARSLTKLALASALVCGCSGGGAATTGPGAERTPPASALYGSVTERELRPEVHGADLTALVAGNTAFALDLYANLAAATPRQNVALGPYSVSQAMAMLYAGAGGSTAAELASVLHFTVEPARFHRTFNGLGLEILSRDGDITLRIANQVWVQTGFAPGQTFLDVLTRDHGAPLAVLDFVADPEAARGAINEWVGDATEDKIEELFPEGTIRSNTRLVLANAIYMHAPWKYKFDPEHTRKAPFTLSDGSTVQVDTMHYDEFLPSARSENFEAVELPYRGDELSMIVIVPEDLSAFEDALTPAVLNEVLDSLRDGGIHLSLPRFRFSFHASLRNAFEELGAPSLFANADLSGIAPGLAVSAIEHEAFVQVDEEGTKAAAATGVAVAGSHGPTVAVDRPFMFFIVDRPTHTVLFIGRVVDPRAAD